MVVLTLHNIQQIDSRIFLIVEVIALQNRQYLQNKIISIQLYRVDLYIIFSKIYSIHTSIQLCLRIRVDNTKCN